MNTLASNSFGEVGKLTFSRDNAYSHGVLGVSRFFFEGHSAFLVPVYLGKLSCFIFISSTWKTVDGTKRVLTLTAGSCAY